MLGFTERQSCPACNTPIARSNEIRNFALKEGEVAKRATQFYEGRLDVKQLAADRFVIMKCQTCSLVYSRYHLDEEGLKHLYERCTCTNLNYEVEVERVKPLVKRSIDVMDAILGISKSEGTRILDFGAGRGIWAREAKSRGYDVTAIELAAERINEMRSHGIPASTGLTDRDQDFKFVYISQVLEHLTEPLTVLKGIWSRCKQGAVLLVGVPNGAGVEKKLRHRTAASGQLYPDLDPFEHINCFSNRSMSELMSHAGFRGARPTDARTLIGAGVILGVRLISLSTGAPGRFFVKG
jgi:SAM-dependent methyltransferase